ncbi:hypothetical protein G3570_01465 [Balneolaceae bacterium YR4-1]|uniref:Uncharacterized protein n=1 Tax=Halalkalibaculum roseum TaxID=2709311 RepID=A0A6M1ST02_9BACT|nr:hypothetical protein [Halalkalibaculum roseum]NGP75286.1 hypothetical protein [Halalkalibaculum roseum]
MNKLQSQIKRLTVILITFTLIISCSSSREVTSYSELADARFSEDPIRVLTVGSDYYTFETFTYNDSTISGEGTREVGYSEESFEGSIYFDDIAFIERLKTNGWKGVWLVPAVFNIAGGVYSLMQPPNFNITRPEGSCPFLYAFDGSEYHLEAEAFSTAISKALETETFHLMPNLVVDEGKLKVRISNERPETHIFNSINLFAVDAPSASEVVLDNHNRVWRLSASRMPSTVQDQYGNEVTRAFMEKDGKFWKSGRVKKYDRLDFRDTLLVTFKQTEGAEEALLRVDAINSTLINEVYGLAGSLVGDETLGFYQTLEQEPELQQFFKDWIDRSSLKVEVKRKAGWKETGRILPEANEVVFSRAMLIENLDEVDGELTLRISSMADVWHVDALSIDFEVTGPLAMEPVSLIDLEATGPAAELEMLKAISDQDSSYAMILPPDHMDLTFDANSTRAMEHPVYIMAARGYLYEWLPEDGGIPEDMIPDWFRNMDSSDMIAFFTRQEDLMLRSVYNRWQQGNHR